MSHTLCLPACQFACLSCVCAGVSMSVDVTSNFHVPRNWHTNDDTVQHSRSPYREETMEMYTRKIQNTLIRIRSCICLRASNIVIVIYWRSRRGHFGIRMCIYIVPADATAKLKRKIRLHVSSKPAPARSEAAVVKDMRKYQHLCRLRTTRGAIFFYTSHTLQTLAAASVSLCVRVVFFQLSRCHFVIGKIVFVEQQCARERHHLSFGRRLRCLCAISILQSPLRPPNLSIGRNTRYLYSECSQS